MRSFTQSQPQGLSTRSADLAETGNYPRADVPEAADPEIWIEIGFGVAAVTTSNTDISERLQISF